MRWLLLCILLLPLVSAATLTGTIYDFDLNPVTTSIIELDTDPQQRIVSTDGSYSVTVPNGKYTLTATYEDSLGNKYSAREAITIKDDLTYTLDLFLYAEIDQDILADDIDVERDINLKGEFPYRAAAIVLLVAAIYFFFKRKKKQPDENVEQIIAIMKRHGGRITQRDLRKELPHSEAKVSLLVTELVAEGKIKKIKKGRSNILVLL